jgi:hypothetical protein
MVTPSVTGPRVLRTIVEALNAAEEFHPVTNPIAYCLILVHIADGGATPTEDLSKKLVNVGCAH